SPLVELSSSSTSLPSASPAQSLASPSVNLQLKFSEGPPRLLASFCVVNLQGSSSPPGRLPHKVHRGFSTPPGRTPQPRLSKGPRHLKGFFVGSPDYAARLQGSCFSATDLQASFFLVLHTLPLASKVAVSPPPGKVLCRFSMLRCHNRPPSLLLLHHQSRPLSLLLCCHHSWPPDLHLCRSRPPRLLHCHRYSRLRSLGLHNRGKKFILNTETVVGEL
ncbi:hypothetical protein CRENBAI_007483, partial [Crenichthys baileyi]